MFLTFGPSGLGFVSDFVPRISDFPAGTLSGRALGSIAWRDAIACGLFKALEGVTDCWIVPEEESAAREPRALLDRRFDFIVPQQRPINPDDQGCRW